MKTATFEFGKQLLADWIAENRDCEKMILVSGILYSRETGKVVLGKAGRPE